MKTNIHTKPATDKHGKQFSWNWYIWTEICDKCSATIFDPIQTTEAPNTEEADFCSKCLQELMALKIPYEEAKKKYKTERGAK